MITPPWVLDSYALAHITKLPENQKQYGWATFEHYYYNSYKVPCFATFLIWGLFLLVVLASGLRAFVACFFPRLYHRLSRRTVWWRGNVSEHPLVLEKHSQVVSCGSGCLSWLTMHLPLRLEAIVLAVMIILNITPLVAFYSLYVGHNTYFVGTDAVSRRSQILRHLANRCAMLAIAQLPMLILLASKRTPVALLSQFSMNTLMLFHRWIARMCYLHTVVHILGNALIFHFGIGFVESLKILPVQLGIVATVMLSGLIFLSLRTLRKRHYEVFVFLHISMAVLLIVFTYLHIKFLHQGRLALQIFVIELTAGLWAFDRLIRLSGRVAMSLSWRYADGSGATRKAQLTSYADGAYTRVRIQVPASRLRLAPSASSSLVSSYMNLEDATKQCSTSSSRSLCNGPMLAGARIGAGDDVRITIPRLQWVGDHPFSVFAVGRCKTGNPDMGYVDLVIQRQAGLTQKLSQLAQELSTYTTDESRRPSDMYLQQAVRRKGQRVRVVIDGPFGRSPSLEGAQHAILVAGGIAITFCYPLLVRAARGEFNSLETCKLVWIVRNEGILDVLRDSLSELLDEIRNRGGSRCSLSIDIYTTVKASAPSLGGSIAVDMKSAAQLPSRPEATQLRSKLMSAGSTSSIAASSKEFGSSHQVWEGVAYKRRQELDLLPVLPRTASRYQHATLAADEQNTFYYTSEDGIDTPKLFDNRFSPAAARKSFSDSTREVLRQSFFLSSAGQSSSSSMASKRSLQGVQSFLSQAQDEGSGSSTPNSNYAESYESLHSIGGQFGHGRYRNGYAEPHPYREGSKHSSADSVYSVLQYDSPSSAHLVPKYSATQEDLEQGQDMSQDVLSQTKGDALIAIRRFQGRPKSMAALHDHIFPDDTPQRIVFATCGPAAMCDAVRAEVVAMLKKGTDVALVEDCFNW